MATNNCKKCVINRTSTWILSMFILYLILYFINQNVLSITFIQGDSMYPTMKNGNIYFVNRTQRTPSLGDIILIRVPSDTFGCEYIVKRVIATSGQKICIDYIENQVRVNDILIDEPYINLAQDDPMKKKDRIDYFEYHIPENSIFVMGDNRNYSLDSRDPLLGTVEYSAILGIVIS